AAKCSSDRLMSEADTQDRDLACEMPDYIDADSRLLRCARPGRDHDPLRVEFLDLVNRGLIVAAHYHLLARLSDVLHQIEGKRIVVIENKLHQQNYRAEPPEYSFCDLPLSLSRAHIGTLLLEIGKEWLSLNTRLRESNTGGHLK